MVSPRLQLFRVPLRQPIRYLRSQCRPELRSLATLLCLAVLADRAFPPGFHALDWDLRGLGGERVKPGVYVYRMQTGAFAAHRKLVLLP
jgi:hypothetical protein